MCLGTGHQGVLDVVQLFQFGTLGKARFVRVIEGYGHADPNAVVGPVGCLPKRSVCPNDQPRSLGHALGDTPIGCLRSLGNR